MRITRTRRLLVALVMCGALGAAAGCAATTPELPLGDVNPPVPAGVQNPAQLPEVSQQPDCGDPTASYRPTKGTDMPPGSSMAKIKANGTLIVGVDQNTYLFGYRNTTNNALTGFDVALAKQIAKAIFGDENAITYKAISSAQREEFVKTGQVDMVVRTMTMNCARWQNVAFSSEYFRAHQKIAVYKGHAPVEKLDDLGGERVCAAIGSTSIRKINDTPTKPIAVAVPEWTDCLVMLQQGTVDAISTDDVILAGFQAQDANITISKTPLSDEPYGIAISKERRDLVEFVNAVLEQVRSSGTWQTLYQATDEQTGESLQSVLGAASPPAAKYQG